MTAEPYYTKEYIKGYTYIGKCIFVYYDMEDIAQKYINTSKFIPYRDTIPRFRAYEDVSGSYCDAFGTIYQIIRPDSFVLVKKDLLNPCNQKHIHLIFLLKFSMLINSNYLIM